MDFPLFLLASERRNPWNTSPPIWSPRFPKELAQPKSMNRPVVEGVPLNSAYVGSKFALEGFSESMKYELEGFGIKVILI